MQGIKWLTQLCFTLNHLPHCKFQDGFYCTLDPFWSCGSGIESTNQQLFYWLNHYYEIKTLLNETKDIGEIIIGQNDEIVIVIIIIPIEF